MKDREYMPSGAELARRRLAAGLTQGDCAVRLGTTRALVSKVEQGIASEAHVRRYIQFLDEVSVDA